jgi:hypothetical protein
MIRFFIAFAITLGFLLSLSDFKLNNIVDLINYPSNNHYFQTSSTDDHGFLKVPYDNCVAIDKDDPYDNCTQGQLWMKISTKTSPST